MRQIKATLWQCAKCFAIEMASSFDSDFYLLRLPRRHSWPEAVQTLRPSTSGIFDPLPDQEEIALRSSMTSRTSNHSMGSCIYRLKKYLIFPGKKINQNVIVFRKFLDRKRAEWCCCSRLILQRCLLKERTLRILGYNLNKQCRTWLFIDIMGSPDCDYIKITIGEVYFRALYLIHPLLLGVLGAWMTFKKAEI